VSGRNVLEDDIGAGTVGSKIEFKVCIFHFVRVHLAEKGEKNKVKK
jgi:hypothetical protein